MVLQAKLTMRAKAHHSQRVRIGQPVNQHEIGSDVAIPVILPLSGQLVIDVAAGKRLIRYQQINHLRQKGIQLPAED
jgi:hypothetical protein